MTNLNDLDRALDDWLAEGPTTVPEAPVIAAMAHARTTPRRPDVFARLRPDVMSRPGWRSSALAPALILAAAGAVVAATLVAVVGSQSQGPNVVLPGQTSSATASPVLTSNPPVATPYESIPASPPASLPRTTELPPLGLPSVEPVHVALRQCCNDTLSVDVVAESGTLSSAVSGPAVEGGSVDSETVKVANVDPRTLRVTWGGSPCDTVHRLTLDRTNTHLTIDRPMCFGDSVPADRVVILTFSAAVDASKIQGTVITARGGIDMPTWTATGIDRAGGRYDMAVFDASQTIAQVEAADATDVEDPGPNTMDLSNQDVDTIRITWNGRPCETAPRLVVSPNGADWALAHSTCDGTGPNVVRTVDLTFTGPRSTDDVRLGAAPN